MGIQVREQRQSKRNAEAESPTFAYPAPACGGHEPHEASSPFESGQAHLPNPTKRRIGMNLKLSPDACREMIDLEDYSAEGNTDCPDGCVVEPDGWCPHGYLSAMETLLRTGAV